jgi:hypothetical protein
MTRSVFTKQHDPRNLHAYGKAAAGQSAGYEQKGIQHDVGPLWTPNIGSMQGGCNG